MRRNVVTFRHDFADVIEDYVTGTVSCVELAVRVQRWVNYVRLGDTWGLRHQVFSLQPPIRLPGMVRGNWTD